MQDTEPGRGAVGEPDRGVYVNQAAAFSDFHATGVNPAANASYTDGDFVAGRFRLVQSRRHLPAERGARSPKAS